MGRKTNKVEVRMISATAYIFAVRNGQRPLRVLESEAEGRNLHELASNMQRSLEVLGLTVRCAVTEESRRTRAQIAFKVPLKQWSVPGMKEQVEGALRSYRPYRDPGFGSIEI